LASVCFVPGWIKSKERPSEPDQAWVGGFGRWAGDLGVGVVVGEEGAWRFKSARPDNPECVTSSLVTHFIYLIPISSGSGGI